MSDVEFVTKDHLERRLLEHRADTDTAIDALRTEMRASISLLASKEDVDRLDQHLTEQDGRLYELKGSSGTHVLIFGFLSLIAAGLCSALVAHFLHYL